MKFIESSLKGAYILEFIPVEDERGFFTRTFCSLEFRNLGLNPVIAQSSISYNAKKGTLRGMHFQKSPFEEAKVVSCLKGSIYDVIIDLRINSPTFKNWQGIELNEKNKRSVYIPEGFAHGFLTLTDDSIISYHMSECFNSEAYSGVRYNDKSFNIDWPFEPVIISAKDKFYEDFIS